MKEEILGWTERERRSQRWQFAIGLFIAGLVGYYWLKQPAPTVVIGVALTPIAAVIVMRSPFILCLCFIAFAFFRMHEIFTDLDDLHLPFNLALASIGALILLVLSGRAKPFWRIELTMLTLFFVHVTIGITFSTDRWQSWQFWTDTYSKIFLMTLAITWIGANLEELITASSAFILCGLIVSVQAIYNKVNGIGLVEETRVTIGRDIGSLLGDPNDLSLVLLFPMCFAMGFLLSPGMRPIHRVIGLISSVIILIAILDTESRGGLLGVAAIIGIYAMRKIKSRLLTIGIAGAGVAGLFKMAGIAGRISGGAATQGIDESSQTRLYAWIAAMRMAKRHPIWGVGADTFRENYFEYTPVWDHVPHAVHSTWFGILGETGIVGLGLFLPVVGLALLRSWRGVAELDRRKAAGEPVDPRLHNAALSLLAGLASFIVSGTFLTQGFTWPLYILLAMTVAVTQVIGVIPRPPRKRRLPLWRGRP